MAARWFLYLAPGDLDRPIWVYDAADPRDAGTLALECRPPPSFLQDANPGDFWDCDGPGNYARERFLIRLGRHWADVDPPPRPSWADPPAEEG